MTRRVALITGITGQDGGHLADLLLAKDYEVHGIRRRTSSSEGEGATSIGQNGHRLSGVTLHYADMTDAGSLIRVLQAVKPHEVYNLAAQSHVHVSFDKPAYTAEVNALGAQHLLEAIRLLNMKDNVRFYQASTSEMYGDVAEVPQRETTPFHPRSPYAIAKLFAHLTTINYREAYGLHASTGICFNHEGPHRGENFVTRKISLGAARWAAGKHNSLKLGNLEAKRDWGHARDFVEGMWLMLQREKPGDYVLATGEQHTVREAVEVCYGHAGIPLEWVGQGLKEQARDKKTGEVVVEIDPNFFRPAEVNTLLGDPSRAERDLGWVPRTTFAALMREMVEADIARIKSGEKR